MGKIWAWNKSTLLTLYDGKKMKKGWVALKADALKQKRNKRGAVFHSFHFSQRLFPYKPKRRPGDKNSLTFSRTMQT
jgi:hypothetical protein